MITVKNLNELNKVIKENQNNLSQFLTGERDFNCPSCGHSARVKFPNEGATKCSNCGCNFDLIFDVQ